MGRTAFIGALVAFGAGCAQWPALLPSEAAVDARSPAADYAELDMASLPLDEAIFGALPELRRGDGAWLIGVHAPPQLVFRRAVPSDAAPEYLGVADPWLADAPPADAAAFAYATAPLVWTDGGWIRGGLSAEVYVTAP
jgi:hypothetical protein